VKLLFIIFTFFPFSRNEKKPLAASGWAGIALGKNPALSPEYMLHWAEDPLAALNLAAKSLSWSAPNLNGIIINFRR
jgi:hypothetical protein